MLGDCRGAASEPAIEESEDLKSSEVMCASDDAERTSEEVICCEAWDIKRVAVC